MSTPGDPTASPSGAPAAPPPPTLPVQVAVPEPPPAPVPSPAVVDEQIRAYRLAAEKAQRELDALRKAQLSEQERIKLERDEFEKRALEADRRAKETLLQARFEAAAAKASCHDPEAAFALADRGLLDVSEDGKPLGIDKAVAALKQAKPYLFAQPKSPSVGSGGGNPGQPASEPTNSRVNGWIRRLAGYSQ